MRRDSKRAQWVSPRGVEGEHCRVPRFNQSRQYDDRGCTARYQHEASLHRAHTGQRPKRRTQAPDFDPQSRDRIHWRAWLGTPALGIGALQVVLDRGQEDDWFGSSFITTLAITASLCLLALVVWEWYHEYPIIDLRLFRSFSFLSANSMMFMLGVLLFASIVMMPLFLQTLMGYTAGSDARCIPVPQGGGQPTQRIPLPGCPGRARGVNRGDCRSPDPSGIHWAG
jgi:hypothetical protein